MGAGKEVQHSRPPTNPSLAFLDALVQLKTLGHHLNSFPYQVVQCVAQLLYAVEGAQGDDVPTCIQCSDPLCAAQPLKQLLVGGFMPLVVVVAAVAACNLRVGVGSLRGRGSINIHDKCHAHSGRSGGCGCLVQELCHCLSCAVYL